VSFSKELKRLKAKEFLEPTKKFLEEKYKNYFKSKFWKEGKGYRTFCPCPRVKSFRRRALKNYPIFALFF